MQSLSRHVTGPLVGLLSGVLSNRAVVIIGALTSFAGFFCATFARSLVTLSVSYGLIGGN